MDRVSEVMWGRRIRYYSLGGCCYSFYQPKNWRESLSLFLEGIAEKIFYNSIMAELRRELLSASFSIEINERLEELGGLDKISNASIKPTEIFVPMNKVRALLGIMGLRQVAYDALLYGAKRQRRKYNKVWEACNSGLGYK